MESSPHRPRCKNGTRRYPKYKDECLTEEEYKARIAAEKERKNAENRQTKKRKPKPDPKVQDVVEEPSLYNSIVNVVKTLTAPGKKEDVVEAEKVDNVVGDDGNVIEEEGLDEDIGEKMRMLLTKREMSEKRSLSKMRHLKMRQLKMRHLKMRHLKRLAIICIPLLMTPISTKKSPTETSSVHSNTPPILLNHSKKPRTSFVKTPSSNC